MAWASSSSVRQRWPTECPKADREEKLAGRAPADSHRNGISRIVVPEPVWNVDTAGQDGRRGHGGMEARVTRRTRWSKGLERVGGRYENGRWLIILPEAVRARRMKDIRPRNGNPRLNESSRIGTAIIFCLQREDRRGGGSW
ncbi:hypothetical protein FB451DRAFT_1189762 [Mycena latifolia]|nr:hypothetical protein FB451DRAFT_1189762 [Mycena latifolia]